MIVPAGEWLNTADAARVAGVKPVTIRQWRRRGYLAPQGLDEHNRPVHTREAVQAAERLVREQGLQATAGKVDPRRLRRPAAGGASQRCADCGYLVSAQGHLRTCVQPGPRRPA